ncbi:hypothetical protein LY76DRAFT_650106 [Colletotrichum caudatum]|nr:hypothetical protein LY76DRAFT_650106 [Colletotrichum caudatum]
MAHSQKDKALFTAVNERGPLDAGGKVAGSNVSSKNGEDGDSNVVAQDSNGKKPGSLYFFFRVHWSYSTPLDHALCLVGLAAAIASGILLQLMTVIFGALVNQFNDFEDSSIMGTALYYSMSRNALWLLYLFIGWFFLVYVNSTCFGLVGIRITRAFRIDFIRSMVSQDITFIDSCAPGTSASTISNSADMVENGSTEKVGNLIQNMSMFVAAFVVAFTREWKLTLVTATTLPVLFIGFKITFGLNAKIKAKIQEIHNTASGLVEEALGSARIIIAFNASANISRKYDDYLAKAQKLGFRKGPIIGIQWSVEFFTIYCAYALAWFYSVKILNNRDISSGGQIISVLLAVLLGTNAASNVAPRFGDFAKASVAAKGMFEMIDRKSEINPLAETGKRPADYKGLVELHDVTFLYPSRPSVHVLYGINLTFEDGKVTALEPVLFSDTIYNNVVHGLYGTPIDQMSKSEKRELVRQACVKAFADKFIEELPQKYDTRVGDRGALLSGGQKQRQQTTIMIAHKLSTVQKADKIIVISQGKVVKQGTHHRLLALGGAYHQLVNAQKLHTGQAEEALAQVDITADHQDVLTPVNSNTSFQGVNKESLALSKTDTTQNSARQAGNIDKGLGKDKDDISRKLSTLACLKTIIWKEQWHIWPVWLLGTLSSAGGGGLFPTQAVLFGSSLPTLQLPPGDQLINHSNF